MKKLLAVVLLVAMASAANAALVMTLDNTSPNPGDVVTATISSDAIINYGINITVAHRGTTVPGSIADLATGPYSPTFGPWAAGFPFKTETPDTAQFDGVAQGAPLGPVNAGDIWSFQFTAPQVLGDYMAETIDGGADDIFDATMRPKAAYSVVPEPMTMSLLGLGGLALIRRRRA